MTDPSNRESIRFLKPASINGLEVLAVENCSRLVKAFHENYLLSFCLLPDTRALAQIKYRGKTHDVPGVCSMLVEPGETTAVLAQNMDIHYVALFIDPKEVETIGTELLGNNRPSFSAFWRNDSDLQGKVQLLYRNLNSASTHLEQQSSFQEVLITAFKRYGESAPKRLPDVGKGALNKVRDRLMDGVEDNVTLDDLARIAGLSKWHLIHAFKQEFNVPPHTFQNLVRIAKLKRLLALGKRQGEIDIGLNSQSQTIRRFRETWGLTPGAYQKLIRC